MRRRFFLISVCSAAFLSVPAGEAVSQKAEVEIVSVDTGRMNRFLNAEAERLSREAWRRIDSPEKLERERARLKKEYLFMLGLDPMPPRTPLEATHVRTVDRGEYTVEVLHFQSLPHFYVTANLYKPKTGEEPFPAVVWGPGHSGHPDGAKALRQNYAIPWVRSGYICLMIDPIQVAEIFGVHRGTHSWDRYDWYARGYSPISIEVLNAIRGVDYLETRSDVDAARLVINGVSGGGHLSWMAGAADERLSVVVPVAGTADVRAHVQLDLQRMHCDCAYFINSYRHDWTTLAALICPRPLFTLNTSGDAYYPPEGYGRVYDRVKSLYTFSGVPERTAMFEMEGPHGYFGEEREKAVEWSDRWLKGEESTVGERPFEEIPGALLSAFGGKFPDDALNDAVQEFFIPPAVFGIVTSRRSWEEKGIEIRRNLDDVVFRNMPDVVRPRVVSGDEDASFVLETEPGIHIGMSVYIPRSPVEKRPAALYIASPGETVDSIWNFMRSYPFPADSTVRYLVYPRGVGTAIWNETEKRRFERSSMLLGRTVDEMRLYDVLCAVEYAVSQPWFDGVNLTIIGKGDQAVLGVYAAVLDDRISRVVLHSPTFSHRTGPIFLNVLRYCDVPQALALLVPRDVVFLTWERELFDFPRNIYRLYGAEDRFRRAYTVTQVLNQKR